MQAARADADRRRKWVRALEPIKAGYVKKQELLRARYKALQLELAALALADSADTAAIDRKIDEMLGLKHQILRNQVDKVAAIRNALDEALRPSYDLRMMNRADRDSHEGGRERGWFHGFDHGRTSNWCEQAREHGDRMNWHERRERGDMINDRDP